MAQEANVPANRAAVSKEKEISAMNLHIGQFVGGQMVTSVDATKYKVKMTLTQYGVSVVGHLTDKLIPYSNIQGIDFKRTENVE